MKFIILKVVIYRRVVFQCSHISKVQAVHHPLPRKMTQRVTADTNVYYNTDVNGNDDLVTVSRSTVTSSVYNSTVDREALSEDRHDHIYKVSITILN